MVDRSSFQVFYYELTKRGGHSGANRVAKLKLIQLVQ